MPDSDNAALAAAEAEIERLRQGIVWLGGMAAKWSVSEGISSRPDVARYADELLGIEEAA